jgi:antirestriction protein ArdC
MSAVYQFVTDQIIKQLEAGTAPWRKPWTTQAPANLISKREYRGINTFLLSASGYPSPWWATYKQIEGLGGNVRKGEHGSMVVFWSVGKEKLNPKTGKVSTPFLLRYYKVFNSSQCEGIAEKIPAAVNVDRTPVERIEDAERIVTGMPNRPPIKASDKAWYSPSRDEVGIPDKEFFSSSEAFYAVLFHELAHSTGHTTRVGRHTTETLGRFGSDNYSREELIAEMGSAMLCGVAGISPAVVENSAAYLKSWIDVLKGDSKLVMQAASAAQKAADYIRGATAIQSAPQEESETEVEAVSAAA